MFRRAAVLHTPPTILMFGLRRVSAASTAAKSSTGFTLDPKYIRQFVFQVHPDRLAGSEAREVNAENLATFNAMTKGQVKGNEEIRFILQDGRKISSKLTGKSPQSIAQCVDHLLTQAGIIVAKQKAWWRKQVREEVQIIRKAEATVEKPRNAWDDWLPRVHWHPDITKEEGQAFLRRLKRDLPTLNFLDWHTLPLLVTPDVYVSVRHSAGILTVPSRYVLPTLKSYLSTSVKVLQQLEPQGPILEEAASLATEIQHRDKCNLKSGPAGLTLPVLRALHQAGPLPLAGLEVEIGPKFVMETEKGRIVFPYDADTPTAVRERIDESKASISYMRQTRGHAEDLAKAKDTLQKLLRLRDLRLEPECTAQHVENIVKNVDALRSVNLPFPYITMHLGFPYGLDRLTSTLYLPHNFNPDSFKAFMKKSRGG